MVDVNSLSVWNMHLSWALKEPLKSYVRAITNGYEEVISPFDYHCQNKHIWIFTFPLKYCHGLDYSHSM